MFKGEFNPENYSDRGLKIRNKIREKQIYQKKLELGLVSEDERKYIQFAKELSIEQFAINLQKELELWKTQKDN